MKKRTNSKKQIVTRDAVRSTDWLEDWERRYNEAEDKWEKAKWARYRAEIREAKLGEKVMILRREYKAAQSSNDQALRPARKDDNAR